MHFLAFYFAFSPQDDKSKGKDEKAKDGDSKENQEKYKIEAKVKRNRIID